MTDPTREPVAPGDEQRVEHEPTRTKESLEDLEPVEDRTADLPPLKSQE